MTQPYGPKTGHYAQAADSYGQRGGKTDTPREMEAKALLNAARSLQNLHDTWENLQDTPQLEKILSYNRDIWAAFYETALQDQDSNGIKAKLNGTIISLASFVFQRSLDIMADPARDKLPVLITINREVAAGLMERPDGH